MPTKEIKQQIDSPVGTPDEETPVGTKKYQRLVMIALLVVAGAAAGTAYYFYSQLNDLKVNPQKVAQEETKTLLTNVGKLIVLPTDEQPTIATVADPEKLKDQPFFAHAKRGDRVLIYTNARKAILYDPVANKIIEVAPVTIGQTAGAATQTPPPQQ